jgi:hypothetical protein
MGEASAGEGAPFDAAKEFDAEKFVQVLEVHEEGFTLANHIIWQGEDTENSLLYATRFRQQDADS